jgi:HNH endonuclease
VLTENSEPVDVAHIYPFSMHNLRAPTSMDPNNIWTVLGLFWSQSRVNAWYEAIFSNGTEVVYNLMCLAPSVHKYHENAYFVLKPKEISDDKKRLTVKFFWLPRNQQQYGPLVDILHIPSIPEDLDGRHVGVGLHNNNTDKRIRSGDEICLETKDPERLPLPDVRILEMQWMLHRVAALSGAAEPRDDFGEETDDD